MAKSGKPKKVYEISSRKKGGGRKERRLTLSFLHLRLVVVLDHRDELSSMDRVRMYRVSVEVRDGLH